MVGRKLVGKSNDWRELDETGKTLSTQDRHSETLEIVENQGRRLLKRRYTGLVYMQAVVAVQQKHSRVPAAGMTWCCTALPAMA